MSNLPGTVAANIGKGLLAGTIGTVAMTVSSTLEMKLRDRAGSSAPAQAAEKVLGIESFVDEADETRFSNLVHWGYGTGWGAVHGLLASAVRLRRPSTSARCGAPSRSCCLLWG